MRLGQSILMRRPLPRRDPLLVSGPLGTTRRSSRQTASDGVSEHRDPESVEDDTRVGAADGKNSVRQPRVAADDGSTITSVELQNVTGTASLPHHVACGVAHLLLHVLGRSFGQLAGDDGRLAPETRVAGGVPSRAGVAFQTQQDCPARVRR
jgi:hypothetical protein